MRLTMRNRLFFRLSCLFLISFQTAISQSPENYRVFLATATKQQEEWLILRAFEQAGKNRYLAVDLNTLETQVIPAKGLTAKETTWPDIRNSLAQKPYIKALVYASRQSFSMQDAGIIHGYPAEKGITLTIDLCPSQKPLDRSIFTSLIREFGKIEQPVPLALSLSGRFLNTHIPDIDWLKELQAKGAISITWINHSYTHYYDPKVPLPENFLLKPGTDIRSEVLNNEKAMLEQGLTPSVFFRFPGLVSDNSVVQQIVDFGLIPVGSDAWLAKGQQSASGSIVLIHGNGNEPVGVSDFLKLLQSEKEEVLSKQWLLYDLHESIGEEFEGEGK